MKNGHFVQIFGGKTGIFQQNPSHKGRNRSGVPPSPPSPIFASFSPQNSRCRGTQVALSPARRQHWGQKQSKTSTKTLKTPQKPQNPHSHEPQTVVSALFGGFLIEL